jgi:hypothetical protein
MDSQELRQESSMTYWWPKLESLGVPVPETVEIGTELRAVDDGVPGTDGTVDEVFPDTDELGDAIREVEGPPAFLRSDQMSAKHRMGEGSKITSEEPESFNLNTWTLFERHKMAIGVPEPKKFYVREWLDLYHQFTAFTETPIAAELRYFILDGEVNDVGFYWPHDAIQRPDSENWEELLTETKETSYEYEDYSRQIASEVAEEFDGYWSVDFALTDDYDWYCIDMARGRVSWHPEGVEKPEEVTDGEV